MKKGFTLIELLVVVLIIGILAAIAYPNYQKAVIKARIAKALPEMKAIQEAEDRFYLANGYYTTNPEELDIDLKLNAKYQLSAGSLTYWGAGPGIVCCFDVSMKGEGTCGKTPGRFHCNGYASSLYAEVCKSLGKPIYSWTPHYTYF